MTEPTWGSARHHAREVKAISTRKLCTGHHGGKRVRATHAGQCNGVTLMIGCEWHARQWAAEGSSR